jgi:hypothetical protein
MEEEACPSQEDSLSKVYRDRQAVAQNLWLRTRGIRPEREPAPTGQDEKDNLLRLDIFFFARFWFSAMRILTKFVTRGLGSSLPRVKWMVAPLTSYPLSSVVRTRASLGIMFEP